MKNMDTRRATLIGLVLVGVMLCCCLLTLSGWAMGGFRALFQAQANELAETQVGIAVEEPVVLDVETRAGAITVVGDGVDEILVEVRARARTPTEAEAVRALLTSEGDTVLLRLEGNEAEGLLVDLLIHTPPETALQLDAQFGDIRIEELRGPLEVTTGLGSVSVDEHAADKQLRIESNNGNIDLSAESVEPGTAIQLSTDVGSITAELPDGIGFILIANTSVGEIQMGGYTLTGEMKEQQQGAGHTLGGVVEPADGRTLTIIGGTGDILIRGR